MNVGRSWLFTKVFVEIKTKQTIELEITGRAGSPKLGTAGADPKGGGGFWGSGLPPPFLGGLQIFEKKEKGRVLVLNS